MQAPVATKPEKKKHSEPNSTARTKPSPTHKLGLGVSVGVPLFLQPKLTVSQPDDQYEQEADRTADKVVQRLAEGRGRSRTDSTAKTDIQRKPIFESDEELQKMEEPGEEETLQCKPIFESDAPPDEDEVQRQGASGGDGNSMSASPGLESRLQSSRGSGAALPEETRVQMESAMGADFTGVRLHTGSEAMGMNKELGAQAFTHGSDIYFGEGNYRPGSRAGDHLLAHELMHVVQQGGGAQVQRIDRDDGDTTTPGATTSTSSGSSLATTMTATNGVNIDVAASRITVPSLTLPENRNHHKGDNGLPSVPDTNFSLPRAATPRTKSQTATWSTLMNEKGFNDTLRDKLPAEPNIVENGQRIYFFKLAQSGELVVGDYPAIRSIVERPRWDRAGNLARFDVDHKTELQLGGSETSERNLELLDASANRSAGSRIRNKLVHATSTINAAAHELGAWTGQRGLDNLRTNYEIVFSRIETETGMGDPSVYWEPDQIADGQHLANNLFQPLTSSEIEHLRQGDPTKFTIYRISGAGAPHQIRWPEGETSKTFSEDSGREQRLFRGFRMQSVNRDTMTVMGTWLSRNKHVEQVSDIPIQLDPVPGIGFAGQVRKSSIYSAVRDRLNVPSMSPVDLSEIDLMGEAGISASGRILPTLPLLRDLDIEILIDGETVEFSRTFSAGDFDLPGPLEVTDSTLRIFAGTDGLGAEGTLALRVERVGDGEVTARVSTESGFSLHGNFNFDTELFSRAEARVGYENGQWSLSGALGIDEGKVRGVQSAEITVGYENDTLSANGTATLDVPGVESGSINMELGPEGFTLGGEFQLSSDIPGIESGSINATLTRSADTGEWQISAGGRAVPSIPGIESELSIQYDNGIITIGGTASYERGILSGEVEFGATNRAVGPDGEPTGEIADSLRAYGSGSLTVTLTPWLAATAGVRFLENGEMEVQGRLGLPAAVDVFDRREMRRNLFTAPTIEIPLFAIPLGPRSIGLVAQIGGGLEFRAGFGPGQLRQLEAEITYNPDHPEQTTVTGRGRFVVPADAGLILSARLGVGASVAIASVTGGLEVAGILGLEAEAGAGVEINWSPGTGITLDAEANVSVNPKFRFEVNAFLRASLDLWVTDISETWRTNLTEFEWGPGITFGLRFPVRYRQGEPFNISFDDLEVNYPDLDITQMAGDLAKDIKDRIF